ncbi:MAG TPA: hypothetical protein VF812_06825 [Ktedonobacterales bacterium]
MSLPARFPRLSAWLLALALVSVATLGAVQGLHALEPGMPPHMEHMHGVITAIRGGDVFAVRAPGHAGVEWLRIARGAHISLAHLQRHMREHAPTDIYYQEQQQGPPLAWIAD